MFACKKDTNYEIYYEVEIQPADYTKSYEAKIFYMNTKNKLESVSLTTSNWNHSHFAYSGDYSQVEVHGIQNVGLINIFVTVNGKKHFNTCNELNCWTEVKVNLN